MPAEEAARLRFNDPRLDSFALAAERRYGLPPGVVLALKNAGERTDSWRVSPAGARGTMQFIDSTRAAYPHNPLDPRESIDAGARYIKDLIRQYGGNAMAAIAHYNGGGYAARAVLEGRPPPAQETRDYLDRVRRYMAALAGE